MTNLKLVGIVLAIGVVLGLVIGTAWSRPPEDWRKWKKTAEDWRKQVEEKEQLVHIMAAQRDSALNARDSALAEADSIRRVALRFGASRSFYAGLADSLQNLLNKADSVTAARLCREALSARTSEATACAQQVTTLERAAQADATALRAANQALGFEREAHDTTKALLLRAAHVISTVPKPEGCGLPLCLAVSPTYMWDDKEFVLSFNIPIGKKWFRPGAGFNPFR